MNEEQELQQQFLQLLSITEDMQQRLLTLEKSNQILVHSQKQFVEWMDATIADIEHYKENAYFEIRDERYIENEKREFWYPQIATREETLRCIIEEGASLARFGDGEFAAIQGRVRHKFQNVPDQGLADRLKEVLHAKKEGFLVAIADNYGNLEHYTQQAKREIRCYMTREVRKEHLSLLERERMYYNAYITRPYVMFADNQTNAPTNRFQQLREIWNRRDCVFVEGNLTRLGVGNDLFDNAASIHRVLGPAENAFCRYNEILECCMKQPKDRLFLLALGPVATVLSYDLHNAGYQAVDIGHVDLEYEWYLKGEGCRVLVKGKYNNEIENGEYPEDINDKKYLSQIIEDFS